MSSYLVGATHRWSAEPTQHPDFYTWKPKWGWQFGSQLLVTAQH